MDVQKTLGVFMYLGLLSLSIYFCRENILDYMEGKQVTQFPRNKLDLKTFQQSVFVWTLAITMVKILLPQSMYIQEISTSRITQNGGHGHL